MHTATPGSKALSFLAAASTIGLLFSVLAGQLLRVPLPGQGGGLLLSDVATALCLVIGFFSFIRQPQRVPLFSVVWLLPFILWTGCEVLVISSGYAWGEIGLIVAYWVRLISTLLLIPVFLIFFEQSKIRFIFLYGLASTVIALSFLGLLQWFFIPDLTFLVASGWDPHQGRLVSTWLDPNFFGIFLALVLPFLLLYRGFIFRLCVCLAMVALLLTASRSSFIAIMVSGVLLSPVLIIGLLQRAQRAALIITLSIGGLALSLFLLATLLLGGRAISLLQHDPTVALRFDSWQTAWNVIEKYPFTGVGYNAYQFAVDNTSDAQYTVHSRAGADNSYLTLWATTGLVGLLLFIAPIMLSGTLLLVRWLRYYDFSSFTVLLGLVTVLIHANFINSLLYSHVLIVVLLLVTYVLRDSNPSRA